MASFLKGYEYFKKKIKKLNDAELYINHITTLRRIFSIKTYDSKSIEYLLV